MQTKKETLKSCSWENDDMKSPCVPSRHHSGGRHGTDITYPITGILIVRPPAHRSAKRRRQASWRAIQRIDLHRIYHGSGANSIVSQTLLMPAVF